MEGGRWLQAPLDGRVRRGQFLLSAFTSAQCGSTSVAYRVYRCGPIVGKQEVVRILPDSQ
jgi:hypothetical protein